MAHHAEELGPQPFQLLYWRHVLQRDDARLHLARLRADGRGVVSSLWLSAAGRRLDGASRLFPSAVTVGGVKKATGFAGLHLISLA